MNAVRPHTLSTHFLGSAAMRLTHTRCNACSIEMEALAPLAKADLWR